MAVKRVLVDDTDGTKAEKTVKFHMDGTSYHLDLSRKNFTALEKVLAPWIKSATTRNGNGSASKGQLDVVREWARGQGYEVSDRGRVSGEIMAAFEESQS